MRRAPLLTGRIRRPAGIPGTRRFDLSGVAIYTDIAIAAGGGGGAPGPPSLPGTPTGLVATPGSTTVALTWTAVSGATSYQVKRGTAPGGPYTTVGTPGTNSYGDTGLTNGTAYYYVVAAVNAAGAGSNSAEATATPVASFLPTDLPGLLAWQRDGAKYQDVGTATPCVATNDPVGNWPDASGNGNHAMQASDLLRPQYKPASKNGLATVKAGLDRTGAAASTRDVTASITHNVAFGDFWWIVVFKAGAAAASKGLLSLASATTLYSQSGKLQFSGVGTFDTTLTVGAWYVAELYRISGTARAALNGVVEVTTFASGGSLGASGTWLIGGSGFAGESFNDEVAEALFYKRTPTLADRQAVVGYLGSKWGITVTP